MAEYENSEELTATCEGEIADLLQADLNLRASHWTNSSTELVTEETNDNQEEICESVVEEIVVEQENESYLTCIDDDCMEESIVYVFEEPIVEFELSDSHYIIQEPDAYELEEPEAVEADTMNSNSSQDADKNNTTIVEENIDCEENVVQETSKVDASDGSVNNYSENELVVNKCTLDLPISSDNSLKTCNFNENSDSVDNNLLINSAFINENNKISDLEPVNVQTLVQVNSLYEDDDSDIVIETLPKNIPEPTTPEINPKLEIHEPILVISPKIVTTPIKPTVIKTPPNMLPSVLNRNKLTPLIKTVLTSDLNSPLETKSPQSDSSSSPALRTLGKDQIKKRLQSFSLMKQGITAIPIKKIISPKQPKVHLQIGEVYDETGRKTDEKVFVKKPPKQGPTPSEKARQVIDEIEQIKREEAAIYEQKLTFMKHSMRDAHKKKSKSRIRDRERTKSPIRRDKKFDKDHSKRIRKISEDDKCRRSIDNDKHRRSFENDKFKKKKRDKSIEKEKPKDDEMPQNWTELKLKKMDFEKINKIKGRIFKFTDERNFKRGEQIMPEVEENLKKEDYVKPQLIFEFPSLLRTPIFAATAGLQRKYFPSDIIRFTEKQPSVSYSENPAKSAYLFRNRKQILSEISDERAEIMMKLIENKNGPMKTGRYVQGVWYSPNYLTESTNEVENVTSYGLSVLSEMYNDEQEEIHEIESEKPNIDSKVKDKKSKKKHKKRQSKSKSRSLSKEIVHEEDDKTPKYSMKHDLTEEDTNKDKNLLELKTKPEEEIQTIKSPFKEENQEKELNEDNTPNTDEYRSNWESDEDILNEIIRTNDRASYNKPYQRDLDTNWEIEEEIPGKYDERRKFDEKERKKGRRSSPERTAEELNRKRSEEDKRKHERIEPRRLADIRPEIEDRRSSMNIRVSEERSSLRHENRRESVDFEYRRSSMNLRRSEEKLSSRYNYDKSEPKQRIDNEEMTGYESRRFSTNQHRSEDKLSLRHSFEKSDPKKSADYKLEHEERNDYESRRPFSYLRRSEEKERVRHHSESDYKKHRDSRNESVEKIEYDRHRKISESDRNRKTSESSKHEDEKRSRRSLEHDRRKLNDIKVERPRSDSDNTKSQEYENKKSRFDSEEKYDHKKPAEEKTRVSSDKDHRKIKGNRRESLEKSRDRKHESEERIKYETVEKDRTIEKHKTEERDHHSSKEVKKIEEKSIRSVDPDHKKTTEIEENKIPREKMLSCSSDDRKRDLKSERSLTPDAKKIDKAKHEENKTQSIVYHKWSSEEDIHKSVATKHYKRKPEDESLKNIDGSSIQLNLNYKYQKSQWSSDEEFDKQKSLSDDRRSRNFDDDLQFLDKEKIRKPRSKSRWGDNNSDNDSEMYQNNYENLLDDDLVNLKDLERNRKLAEEIKEKRNTSIETEDEYSRKSNKKKSKAEKKKAEEKEKYKKNKKKSKDKKMKLKNKKSKDKKPKVKITYSDVEDSYDEDFKTAKQKEQDLLIKVNNENAKKYAAKIKIDYSDFDLSLSESKDRYVKKLEENLQTSPEISTNVDLLVTSHTPKERKMNIDLSEIIIDHQASVVKNIEIKSTISQAQSTDVKKIESVSPKTPELPKTIPETPESPIVNPDSLKPTQNMSKLLKFTPKSPELPKLVPKLPEISKSIQKTSELSKINDISNDLHTLQEIITPTYTNILKIPEEKTPKLIQNTEPRIEGITPIVSKERNKSPVMITPTVTTMKMLPEISPVAPPVLPIPKPVIELPVTPQTPDPSKLVSEYEEFMKAVCFDEPKDDTVVEISLEVKEKLKLHEPEKQKKEDEEMKPIEQPKYMCSKDDESDSSLEETSSEYESSDEEHSDTSSESESLSPDSAKMKMLETVAKIKTEKVTDSENDSQESRSDKRKRNERDSSSDIETFENIIVKTEKDSKKMKKSEDVKTFECESKYDNIIDWEKSCVDNTNLYKNYNEQNKYSDLSYPTIDISEMMPPSVLPENIPLPNDNIVGSMSIQDIPTPDYSVHMRSPVDVFNISSDSTTPSPTKKLRSFIPIKLLTAESRKQANETAKLVTSDHTSGFGKFTPKDLITQDEDKIISVGSSSDISLSNSESFSTVTANETGEDQEQTSSRKRQSQWALNITPSKKPLLQTTHLGEDDSDEDFTDKIIKQSEKKQDTKKPEETKDKETPEVSTMEPPKSELSVREDKKDDKKSTSSEPRKTKEDEDKSRKIHDKPRDKSRHSPDRHKDDHKPDHRSLSPKSEKDKRTPRRFSRERADRHDKNDRNDNRKDKTRESLDRKRDRSLERNRDRAMKESLRDREKRRLSDHRLSDRKPTFSRGRSPRTRYSREQELQRPRPRERSKDRTNKHKEPERERERDRSRERIREMDRGRGDKDHRERDDRRNYRRDDRRYSRSQSPHRKDYRELDNIPVPHLRPDDTDFSATSMDIVQSPVNSPLDGFKRSLADSTISDSELITQLNTPDESNEPSPAYSNLHPQHFYPQVKEIPPECRQITSSPKRISLDDRINLVLGLEKEPPKQIDTVCTRGPYTNATAQNYDPYGYSRSEYDLYNSQQQSDGYVPPYSNQYQAPYYPNQLNTDNNIKVVQVGNVIQVVPTEQPIVQQSTSSVPIPKPVEVPPKVVQVGNMLQIVPMSIIETTAISSPVTTITEVTEVVVEKPVVTKTTDQLAQERRAEKEKRRQEREQRRKEKERKRKEKEKRRQLKIKTKTENMIKRALLLETGEGELDISNIDAEPPAVETNDNNNLTVSWPPASLLTTVALPKPPSKGILVSHGFREKDESSLDDSTETRKVVKFADGICPGEGTSPSGGEELPSPPPPPRKLPKEKRYKRIKSNKTKKKIKVKIIRTQQQAAEEESSSEDNLPPPPPPPGSPPPHLWPPRVKQAPVNNIHPSLPGSVFPHVPPAYSTPQQVMYPPAYPPLTTAGQSVPVVMGHAPPPPSARQHHPPVMPVLQTGPPPPPPHHGAHQSSFHH